MNSDIQMYSIMNSERFENKKHLFYLINYIYKDYLSKNDAYVSDICVVASPGEIRDQGSFEAGDIIFTIEFNGVFNGPKHEYTKGAIVQSPKTEFKVSWIFNDGMRYFIPVGIYNAMNLKITVLESDEILYNYKNEIALTKDEDMLPWISFIDFVLKEDRYNTKYADSVRDKQQAFKQSWEEDQKHSVVDFKMPMNDVDDGETKVIDSKMFLN